MDQYSKQIKNHENINISPESQRVLNSPLAKELSEAHVALLERVLGKIESGEVDLHVPEKIRNEEVYAGMSEVDQAEADMVIRNVLAQIRQVKDLADHPDFATQSFQMESLLAALEEELGNAAVRF